jgi:Heterokaryon incompatibility protein (HET)
MTGKSVRSRNRLETSPACHGVGDPSVSHITCSRCSYEWEEKRLPQDIPNADLQAIYARLKLQPGFFRLLLVGRGAFEDELVCNLVTTSLKTKVPWIALSYCWGDPESQAEILVNKIKVSVTKNLELALRYMRHPQKPIIVWVDAISINQNDFEERNAQVKIMGQIYSKGMFLPNHDPYNVCLTAI